MSEQASLQASEQASVIKKNLCEMFNFVRIYGAKVGWDGGKTTISCANGAGSTYKSKG